MEKQKYIVRNAGLLLHTIVGLLQPHKLKYKKEAFFDSLRIPKEDRDKTNIVSIKKVKRLKKMNFSLWADGSMSVACSRKGFLIVTIYTKDENLLNVPIDSIYNGKYCGQKEIFRIS